MNTNPLYMNHFTLVISNDDIDYYNHKHHHINIFVFPRISTLIYINLPIVNRFKCLLLLLELKLE
jgi:hypothetical protein